MSWIYVVRARNCEKQYLIVGRLEYYKRATWNDLQLLTLHYISLRASSTFTLLQQQLPSSISCILLPATVIRTNAIQIRSGLRGIGWLRIRFITVLIEITYQSIQDGGKKVTDCLPSTYPSIFLRPFRVNFKSKVAAAEMSLMWKPQQGKSRTMIWMNDRIDSPLSPIITEISVKAAFEKRWTNAQHCSSLGR